FGPLLDAAQMGERYDICIMSNKGMSVTATRRLIDAFKARGVEKILVAHEFYAPGFSIFGKLGTDSRRYQFDNEVTVIDIGLRLTDVLQLGLEGEPVTDFQSSKGKEETMRRHGAKDDEIDYTSGLRVELNALTAPQFIEWLGRKLVEHGV